MTMVLLSDEEIAALTSEAETLDAEAEQLAAAAEEIAEQARAKRRLAGEVRVTLERHRNAVDLARRSDVKVSFRNLARTLETFTMDDMVGHLNAPRSKVQSVIDDYLQSGQLARSKRGRQWIYAWLAPDADCSARPRRETPERLASLDARRVGGAVAGSGRTKMSGRKDVDRIARAAAKQGATVEKLGNDHIRMTKDGKSVKMASTPRGSGMGRTKKELLDELGIAV